MPLLTINSTRAVDTQRKETFFEEVATLYAEMMDSSTEFLSVKLHRLSREDVWLGRADPDADIVILEADIRGGRPHDQRRAFALAFMEKLHDEWEIPHDNMKVVFTEHEGPHLMGYNRVGSQWSQSGGQDENR